MTATEAIAAIVVIAGCIAMPFALLWAAGRLRELPPHIRQALDSATDAAGADEGGVAR